MHEHGHLKIGAQLNTQTAHIYKPAHSCTSTRYHLLCSTHSHNMGPFTTRVDGISCCMTTSDRPHSSVLTHHETVQYWSGWHQLLRDNQRQVTLVSTHTSRHCSTGVDDISCHITTNDRPYTAVLSPPLRKILLLSS